jgi:hypothetical protein
MERRDKLNAVPVSKQRPPSGTPRCTRSIHLPIRDNVWKSMRLGCSRILHLNRVAGYGFEARFKLVAGLM